LGAIPPFSRLISRFGLLFLGALLPLIAVMIDPAGSLPGTELGDVYKHAWSFWHTPHALGAWPWTEALNAPAGGVLWDVMLLPSLLMAPFQWLLGPVLSANLWVLISLFLVGLSTAALARHLGATDAVANTAGFLAQGAPYLYGYPLYSGVHERLAIWVFPLLLLCAFRLRDGASRRWLALGVGGFALASAGCGVYGIWALLMMGLVLPLLRVRGDSFWGFRRQLPLFVGLAAVSLLLLAVMSQSSGANSLSPQPDRFGLLGVNWDLGFSKASFSSLFSPLAVRSTVGIDSGDLLMELSYVGWLQLGLCLWGLKHPASRWLCAIAIVFVVLSLGPVVEVSGQRLSNPLYWAVSWVLPMYGSAPVPFQQVGVFASLAGLGLLAIPILKEKRGQFWLFLIVLASMAERALVLPTGLVLPRADASVSPIYASIESGQVVEFPRDYKNRALSPGRLFLAQTQHHQGLPVSISTGITAWDGFFPIRTGLSQQWERDLECMRRGGFSWIVVDRDSYSSSSQADESLHSLREILGPPVSTDTRLFLFSLRGLGVEPDENRFLVPFQFLSAVDNGGLGPPPEKSQATPGIRSGRETSICPIERQGMHN